MILTNRTVSGNTFVYEHGVAREPEQYLYTPSGPWMYVALLGITLCRRLKGVKSVYYSAEDDFVEVVKTKGGLDWRVLDPGVDVN
jgi:hypothetical protein